MGRIMVVAPVAVLLLTGAAFAQNAAPAATTAPAATAPAATDKVAKSKACSAEADKQGLHGKARKAFRSKCKAGKA